MVKITFDRFTKEENIGARSSLSNTVVNLLFFIFLFLLFVTHFITFLKSNSIIDSDQPFLWAGAIDYANGVFMEPRFYGQDYNSFLEPLFAVPFMWLGVPVYYALPLATHILLLTPILFTAFYLFGTDKKLQAVLVIGIFLCLTPAYNILSTAPRGFVTGLFFTTFFILSIHHPNSLKYLYLNSVLLVIGFFINPNILIVAVPFLFYLFLHQYKNKHFYYCMFFCLLCFIPLYFIFDRFYDNHPNYVIYNLVHSYSFDYFVQNISNLNQPFAHVSFFVEENCVPLFAVFLILLKLFYKTHRLAFYAFVIFVIFIFITFLAGKTREGTFWPLYSYSRMYLGIPLVIALFISLLPARISLLNLGILLFIFLFSIFKLAHLEKNIGKHLQPENAVGVHFVTLESTLGGIKFYKEMCEKVQSPHLLVSSAFWLSTYLTYGGRAVFEDFPSTEETYVDRRYWIREYNKDKIFDRFVIISINSDFDKIVNKKYNFKIKRLDDYGLFLVTDNELKNKDFITLMRSIEDNLTR